MFEKFNPLLTGATLADPKEEFKNSKRFEKYRMSSRALFIPAGFAWNYLPLKEITRFKKVTRFITSDNGVCPFSMEAPGIRIHYRDAEDLIEVEKDKNAEAMLLLIAEGSGLEPA